MPKDCFWLTAGPFTFWWKQLLNISIKSLEDHQISKSCGTSGVGVFICLNTDIQFHFSYRMKSESSFWVTQDLMHYIYRSQTRTEGSMDRQGDLKSNFIDLISCKNLFAYYYLGHCRLATKLFFLRITVI